MLASSGRTRGEIQGNVTLHFHDFEDQSLDVGEIV